MDLILGTTEIQMNLPWIVFQQKKEYNKEYLRNILTVRVRLYHPILIIMFLRTNTTIGSQTFWSIMRQSNNGQKNISFFVASILNKGNIDFKKLVF